MSYFINLSLLKRNRNYRLLYAGQFVSFIGTMITSVALPFQIYHETHSTLMVGLLSLFQLLPLLLTALLGGVLADRHHRRKLLIIAVTLLAIGCALLAYNAFATKTHIWPIFVIAVIMSGVTGLHRPAFDGIMQQIVDRKDFPMVGALSTFMYSVCMIAGPAVGGIVIAHVGLVEAYILDFSTFIVSLIVLLMIRNIPNPEVAQDASTWTSLKEGFRYAFSSQELQGTYYIDIIAMIFGMPMALLPAIAQTFGGVETLGMLYSAPAVGALLISFFSGWTAHIKRHGAAIAIAAIFWGAAIIGFGIASNFWLALFFLALAGAFDALSGIFRQTMWNELIPNELRGRLSGIAMISYLSGPKLGDTEAGLVAAAFGITASVISGGVLCDIGVGICCYFLPKFWRYRSVH